MYLSCDSCGHTMFIPRGHLPIGDEPEPIACMGCGKEWEMLGDQRRGVILREVNPAPPKPKQ